MCTISKTFFFMCTLTLCFRNIFKCFCFKKTAVFFLFLTCDHLLKCTEYMWWRLIRMMNFQQKGVCGCVLSWSAWNQLPCLTTSTLLLPPHPLFYSLSLSPSLPLPLCPSSLPKLTLRIYTLAAFTSNRIKGTYIVIW